MTNHPAQRITIYDIAEIFGKAYVRTAAIDKAIKGFKTTGIVPIDPDVFSEEDYLPSEVTDRPLMLPLENSVIGNDTTVETLDPIPSTSTTNESLNSINNDAIVNTVIQSSSKTIEQADASESFSVRDITVIINKISPLPKSQRLSKETSKRKAQKGEELTSSPFKQRKEEEEREKITKKKGKGRPTGKKKSVKSKKILQEDSDEADDAECIYCNGRFRESKSCEGWIQCRICTNWAHDACAGAEEEDDNIICEKCE